VGWLDAAACDGVRGWARDLDTPDAAIDVHVYFGGPPGDPAGVGYPVRAGQHRDDLCTAIGSCAHGFNLPVPHGFMDGVERPVFAYGIDAMGGENPQLSGAPQMLRCERPELPYAASSGGVLRHVPSPEVMAAWSFDFHDVIVLDDAEIDAFTRGEPVPAAPRLVRTEGDPKVYLADGMLRRHVPDPAAMAAWRFSFGAIELLSGADLELLEEGDPIASRPWLVRGSGPEVYLLDAEPPREEVLQSDGGPGPGPGPGRDAGAGGGGDGRRPGLERESSMLEGGCSASGRPSGGGLALGFAIAAMAAATSRRCAARRGGARSA
jgi:hypothetical protein